MEEVKFKNYRALTLNDLRLDMFSNMVSPLDVLRPSSSDPPLGRIRTLVAEDIRAENLFWEAKERILKSMKTSRNEIRQLKYATPALEPFLHVSETDLFTGCSLLPDPQQEEVDLDSELTPTEGHMVLEFKEKKLRELAAAQKLGRSMKKRIPSWTKKVDEHWEKEALRAIKWERIKRLPLIFTQEPEGVEESQSKDGVDLMDVVEESQSKHGPSTVDVEVQMSDRDDDYLQRLEDTCEDNLNSWL